MITKHDEQTGQKWPALSLTVLGALLRLAPHPPNIAPVGAMSLFSGATLPGWQAYLVPLLLMLVTDPILAAIGGYQVFGKRTFFVYSAFMISVWIGRRLRGTTSIRRIGLATFACAVQFYLNTNFQVWLFGTMYSHDLAGLATCYVAALPFFGYTLIGNALYSAVLFGSYFWLVKRQLLPVRP